MRYNQLGRSGLYVSELCLGTMTFGGGEGRWRAIGAVQQEEANTLVKTSLDAGINFIDTANVYAEGLSERILGQSLRDLGIKRDEVIIATKVLARMGPSMNQVGASRGHIFDQVHKSLERLQLDHIDLYQIHGFDPGTPVEETIEALDAVVRQGLVRYIGLSNWAAWQVAKAVGISERKNLARVVSLQSYYTLVGRDLEREIIPMMKSESVGLMVWSPLAGGYLSGKYNADITGGGEDDRRTKFHFPPIDTVRGETVLAVLRAIATERGTSSARIALTWLLHQPAVSTVIIGAKRLDQLEDNLGATELELNVDELTRLSEASRLPAEYPGWMLEMQGNYRALPPARTALRS